MSRVMTAAEKRLTPLSATTEEDLARMRLKRDRLREVERIARDQLDQKIAIATVALNFPNARLLAPEVLRWRYGHTRSLRANIFRVPVPKLALINVKSPTFYIKRSEHSNQESSTMPKGLIDRVYSDITRQLDRATALGKRYTLSYTWHGIIPEAASATIDEAERFFGQYDHRGVPRVYLLTEAPFADWTMESEPSPPRPRIIDPLIVGHGGNGLYVVGAFDPTPLEQYIAEEFTA